MANIPKMTDPYFTDNVTRLEANTLNPIISKLNEVIEAINSGVTPTPTQTVARPTISISGTTATISCSTSGATIRYAINGTPTESSGTVIANGGTVNLSSYSQSTVIRAIAYKSGMTTSQVAQETYNPSVQPVAPTMVLNTTAKTVALSATSGLTIKYSTNGGTPATTYSSPINVANGATIKAITTNGTTSSSVPKITVKFNEELNTIQFLSSQTGDIVYTTDGSTPNASSTQYSGEITPSVGTTYKVAVYNNGVLVSEVATIQIAS